MSNPKIKQLREKIKRCEKLIKLYKSKAKKSGEYMKARGKKPGEDVYDASDDARRNYWSVYYKLLREKEGLEQDLKNQLMLYKKDNNKNT